MTIELDRGFYNRSLINLWVEDQLSREYLSAVWGDSSTVAFFIAGGNEGVRSVVKDAGLPNVFGLIDRDFGTSNNAEWFNPSRTFQTFSLPVHEIENYLLDAAAISASRWNNLVRTESEIDGYLDDAAREQVWWIACREVLAELKHRFRDSFTPDPGLGTILGLDAAVDYLCRSHWYSKLSVEVGRSSESDLRALLIQEHQRAEARHLDGGWRAGFAGKEIFRRVGSRIFDRQRFRNYQGSKADFDIDLAKEIAAWQVKNHRVPQDLIDLLAAIKTRVERLPPP